jgi:hypothetical protein
VVRGFFYRLVMELKMKPAIEKVGNLIITLLIFVFVLVGTSYIVPYFITHETYSEASRVRETFPIAILDHDTPHIVCWGEYQKNVDLYKETIISTPTQKRYKFSEDGFFELRSASNNVLKFFICERDRLYWAKYSVSNGIVRPISYRAESPSVVFFAVPAAFIGTPLIVRAYKRFLRRNRRREK